MLTVNYLQSGEGRCGVNFPLQALNYQMVRGDEAYGKCLENILLSADDFALLHGKVQHVGVSERFRDVMQTFPMGEGETPPGFRIESSLQAEGLLLMDLVRDISCDKNGMPRPTKIVFSADTANPYELKPIAPLLGNLTCNPGIVYDLFINNPKANVDNRFTTRDEVMVEISKILGPGCDISVELNNPFEEDFDKILEEVAVFEKILTKYRLVVKVPHTGPVNAENVDRLLQGDKRLDVAYNQGSTADALRGHNLALKLREHGYRINYTLMFEPYQTNLALQAKPAFINTFVRHRQKQTSAMLRMLDFYDLTGEREHLEAIRQLMLENDYLPKGDDEHDLLDVLSLARDIVHYRNIDNPFGEDGLDAARHNLRLLRQNNLRDTRLIICSMEGPYNYPDIDRLMADPEYQDVIHRMVITAEPGYLAQFTSTNQVVSYQRRFMNAAPGK